MLGAYSYLSFIPFKGKKNSNHRENKALVHNPEGEPNP